MKLSRRDPLGNNGSHNATLDIIFIAAVAVLVTLLCIVAILHCILRRQRRQPDDRSSTPIITLQFVPGSKGKNNDPVAPGSKYAPFPTESGSPFRFPDLGPSSLSEKTSENDMSNQPTIACPIASYLPSRHHILRPPIYKRLNGQ